MEESNVYSNEYNEGTSSIAMTPKSKETSLGRKKLEPDDQRDGAHQLWRLVKRAFSLNLDEHEADRFSTSYFIPYWALLVSRSVLFLYVLTVFFMETVRLGVMKASFRDWYCQFWNLYWIGLLLYFFLGVCYSASWHLTVTKGGMTFFQKLLWAPACRGVQHYLYMTVVIFPLALLLQVLMIRSALISNHYLTVDDPETFELSSLDRIHILVQWSYLVCPFVMALYELVFSRIKLYFSQLWQILLTAWLYIVGVVIVVKTTYTAEQQTLLYNGSAGKSMGVDFLIVFFSTTGLLVLFFIIVYLLQMLKETMGLRYGKFYQVNIGGVSKKSPNSGKKTSSIY